jgi:hypothetical protein
MTLRAPRPIISHCRGDSYGSFGLYVRSCNTANEFSRMRRELKQAASAARSVKDPSARLCAPRASTWYLSRAERSLAFRGSDRNRFVAENENNE